MADDLEDEWWKDSDDNVGHSAGEESGEEKPQAQKRGVKCLSKHEAEADSSDELDQKVPAKRSKSSPTKQKAGKKKKNKKQFVRKKITEVDEDTLKKGGTPADVQALLRPSVIVSKSDASPSESDENDSDNATLSADSDFFPTHEEQPVVDYLTEMLPGWQLAVKKAKLSPGSPLMLILCSSAIRAVQLNRELKCFFGKDCRTAKLFAKHMKLEEQKTFLQKKVCHASIGTPNRVQALLEAGCLKLNQLHAIVLDWNWRDVKLKRMVDIPDVRRDLTVLLKEHAMDHIKHSPCRIAIL